jgi:archaellum component FlaC
MNALDNEYEELKSFLHVEHEDDTTLKMDNELNRLRTLIKNVKSKVEYMEADFPANTHLIGLKELLREA